MVMVAVINVNEVTKKHAIPLSKVSNGYYSASCQGSKAADIGETCSCKQTSRLTLYRLLWPRKILPWTMWLCSKEQTFIKPFEEL